MANVSESSVSACYPRIKKSNFSVRRLDVFSGERVNILCKHSWSSSQWLHELVHTFQNLLKKKGDPVSFSRVSSGLSTFLLTHSITAAVRPACKLLINKRSLFAHTEKCYQPVISQAAICLPNRSLRGEIKLLLSLTLTRRPLETASDLV